jgi:hypothetical protein
MAALFAKDQARLRVLRRELETLEFTPDEAVLARRLIRRDLVRVAIGRTPSVAGIYVLHDQIEAYVGLAVDIGFRFHGPFGHLSAKGGKTRARGLAGTARHVLIDEFVVSRNVKRRRLQLARRELFWYQVLRASGYLLANTVGSLGSTPDNTEAHLVACRLADGRLSLHHGVRDASVATGVPGGPLAATFRNWQSQSHGYTFRYATPDEIAAKRPIAAKSDARMDGSLLAWTRGGVPKEVRTLLTVRNRGGRYKKRNGSGYIGVYRNTNGETWDATYVDNPDDRSSPKTISRGHADPAEASNVREAFLDARPALRALNPRGGRRRASAD